MLINVGLAMVGAIFQFANAWLGWKVTVNPKLSPKQKKHYHIGFVVFGLLGVLCVGLIAARSGRVERAHFDTGMQNTHYRVAAPFSYIQPDMGLDFNIVYQNVGPGTAVNADAFGRAFLEADESRVSEDDAIAEFMNYKKDHEVAPSVMPKGQTKFVTAHGPTLSQTDVDDIKNSRKIVYVVGSIAFQDDFGTHEQEICRLLVPPRDATLEIWQDCHQWNGETSSPWSSIF